MSELQFWFFKIQQLFLCIASSQVFFIMKFYFLKIVVIADPDSLSSCRGINSVKYVRGGVAIEFIALLLLNIFWIKLIFVPFLLVVQLGRTRSLVERWEQRERCTNTEAPTTISSSLMPEPDTLRPSMVVSLCILFLESCDLWNLWLLFIPSTND